MPLHVDETSQIVDYAEDTLHRPFIPDSPKQLAAVLFNKADATDEQGGPGFGFRVIKRNKTGPSTDAEVLEKLAEDPAISNPIPKLIVEHRELSKLVNTYLGALARNRRLSRALGIDAIMGQHLEAVKAKMLHDSQCFQRHLPL